jgi:hypothetical protein
MSLRIIVVLVGFAAFVAGWGTLHRSTADVVFAQDRSQPLLTPQGTPSRVPIAEPAPIDPSVPAAEAKLIRDLQLRVATLERQVQELRSNKPHLAPLSGNPK